MERGGICLLKYVLGRSENGIGAWGIMNIDQNRTHSILERSKGNSHVMHVKTLAV